MKLARCVGSNDAAGLRIKREAETGRERIVVRTDIVSPMRETHFETTGVDAEQAGVDHLFGFHQRLYLVEDFHRMLNRYVEFTAGFTDVAGALESDRQTVPGGCLRIVQKSGQQRACSGTHDAEYRKFIRDISYLAVF